MSRNWLIQALPARCTASALLCLLVAAGCASQSAPRPPAPRQVELAFLDQPHLTRSAVEAALGSPDAVFEKDGVITYLINHTDRGDFVVTRDPGKRPVDWNGVTHDLVLAIDDSGDVTEHRVIEIHELSAPR